MLEYGRAEPLFTEYLHTLNTSNNSHSVFERISLYAEYLFSAFACLKQTGSTLHFSHDKNGHSRNGTVGFLIPQGQRPRAVWQRLKR